MKDRALQINEAAKAYQEEYETTELVAFTHGAVWADEHPKSLWHDIADGELPKNGANILCYHWYDGPHYFQGYYIADSKEVKYELPNDGKCDIELVDSWMEIPKVPAEF